MNFALLIARQRSGTGAIGSVLDKHPSLKYLGEVFHPGNIGEVQNFFTYCRDRGGSEPERLLPDNLFDLFLGFMDEMSARYPDRTLIVDVKYRSLHHLNGGWQGLVQRPKILQEVINRRLPILHLTRNNFVESFVSGRLAEENKVWHASSAESIRVSSVTVDIRNLSNYVVNTEREVALIREWTGGYGKLVDFDYADMMDGDGHVEAGLAEQIAKTLGVAPFTDRAPSFVKQAPSHVRESIENFDLVKRALNGSGHEWMLC